eukprot:scaffold247445_cov21-Prasinocladus_malaysianus.AAC.2
MTTTSQVCFDTSEAWIDIERKIAGGRGRATALMQDVLFQSERHTPIPRSDYINISMVGCVVVRAGEMNSMGLHEHMSE